MRRLKDLDVRKKKRNKKQISWFAFEFKYLFGDR